MENLWVKYGPSLVFLTIWAKPEGLGWGGGAQPQTPVFYPWRKVQTADLVLGLAGTLAVEANCFGPDL